MRKIKLIKEPGKLDLEELRPRIEAVCEKQKIELLYFFGGSARGVAGKLADIDLAFYAKGEVDLLGLQNDLSRVFKRDDVDLVDLKTSGPLIAYKAIKEGKLVFCRNEAARVFSEYLITARYLSTIHLRNEYHRNLSKTVLNGGFYAKD